MVAAGLQKAAVSMEMHSGTGFGSSRLVTLPCEAMEFRGGFRSQVCRLVVPD